MTDIERIPVIIGVGQINDRPEDPDNGLDPLGLMVAALKRAEADSGITLLSKLDSVAVVDQISFRDLNPLDRKLADALGANPSVCYQSEAPHGDTRYALPRPSHRRRRQGHVLVDVRLSRRGRVR